MESILLNEINIDDILYTYTDEFLQENEIKDISPEQIQEICKYMNLITPSLLEETDLAEYVSVLTEDVKADNFKYEKVGLNSGKVKSAINKTAKQSADIIKKEGLNSKSKSKIVTLYKDMLNSIEEFNVDYILGIPDSKKEELAKHEPTKLKKAAVLLIEVILIHDILSTLFSILFGPIAANIILGVIIAPITEESAKALSIKGGYEKEFFLMFNILECGSYVMRSMILGVPFKNALRARLICVGMHLTNTIIQWLSRNEKIQKALKLNIEDEEDKETCGMIGQMIGWFIHTIWNLLASFSLDFDRVLKGL